ncbi:hypothetical protein Tco_1162423 [Tanacetum coccineum]
MSEYEGLAFIEATQLLLLLIPTLPSEGTEVIKPELLTLEFELILEMEEVGLKCSSYGESGVKNVNLVSFKNSDKSSSFIFFERSSALDSSFEPDSVWAVFNPSLADLVLSTRTLGLDPVNM